MKRCTQCEVEKPLDQYPKDKRARDGRSSSCKACAYRRQREWAARNPDKVAASRRRYRAKHGDVVRERDRQAKSHARNRDGGDAERRARHLRRAAQHDRGERSCARCFRVLPLDEFLRSPTTTDGLSTVCRGCAGTKAQIVDRRLRLAERGEGLCASCGAEKPLLEFSSSTASYTGHRHQCKSCSSIQTKRWRSSNPGKARELSHRWGRTNSDNKKRCHGCKSVLPADHFYPSPGAADGRASHCRSCITPARQRIGELLLLARFGARRCGACRGVLPSEDFSRDKNALGGLDHKCRACRASESARDYEKNRDKRRQSGNRWHEENKEARRPAYRRASAMRRARKLTNGPFEKIDDDMVFERDGGKCCICGDLIEAAALTPWGTRGWHLDHIVPLTRGGTHTVDNVGVAHWVCNVSKGNRLPEAQRD